MPTQTTLDYRTNRDLFSNYHLDEHLPETEPWNEIDEEELQAAYDEIKQLWDDQKSTVERRNESQLEEKFIRPMFRKLGIPFEVEESTEGTQRRPDYGFFETDADATDAFQRREDGGDFYNNAVAVADAKRWGRKLDTRGKKKRDYENPSHQIDQYLRFTSTTWGVLTNGQKWRLYYKPTSHKLDSYYEVDLPTVLETGNLEEFKYFYLFFRHEAFVPDASGDAFLDDVYEQSNLFAQDLGQDLQNNIYDAIVELSEGFLQYHENELGEDDLDLIHDSSLIYLYRVIFVLYAEAEGRDLLNTNNEIYESRYSLNQLKQEVTEELESGDPKYRDWGDDLHSQLDELFTLIDQGSKSQGIPEDDLHIPAYNGGLFRTDPDESGSREAQFLAKNTVGDEHLAQVIELLTRSESSNGAGKIFVDYSSLDVRHLGSIYEGLLEYDLNVADEPLALDDGEYVVADEDSEIVVERDDVYLTTDSGERKATGSYYTPEYVVEYIVDETLRGPVDEIRKDVVMDEEYQDGGYADEFARRVFDLKILDPAMGSGHFLTSVVDYLARAIITEQNREADEKGGEVIDDKHDISWARRKVAQRCIYGVDINPLATELAKVSLWLRTLAAEQPLAFLDHHLKTGNSLVGSDIQDVLVDDDESKTEEGQLTLEQSFAHTRKQALDHVMDRFSELLAIDNETLEDAKEMEGVYQSVQNDSLYQKLLAMANVHTASQFGLNVPSDADKQMAEALRDDLWEDIEKKDWFHRAQVMADDEKFFHWELEFPIAFYDLDGGRKVDDGFDAVIGNPPYVNISQIPEQQRGYLSVEFSDTYAGNSDILYYFMQKGISVLRDQGVFGLIVARYFAQARYADGLRKYLLEHSQVKKIVDFGNFQAFPGVDVLADIVFCVRKENPESYDVSVLKLDRERVTEEIVREALPSEDPDTFSIVDLDVKNLSEHPWNLIDEATLEIKQKMESTSWSLGEDYEIVQSMQTGFNEGLVVDEETIKEYDLEQALLRKLAKTKNVRRYLIKDLGEYVLWTEVPDIDEYPNTKDYLKQYQEDLADRYDIKQRDANWWQISNPRNAKLFDKDEPRILTPFMSTSNKFAIDTEKRFNDGGDIRALFKKDHSEVSMRYVLSILNSSLGEFYHKNTAKLKRDGYYEYYGNALKNFPIYQLSPNSTGSKDLEAIVEQYEGYLEGNRERVSWLKKNRGTLADYEGIVHELLTEFSERMREFREARLDLNVNFLDYLSNYNDGSNLPDIGLFQPTSENILNATTEDYEKLQIERARTKRDDTTITIEATARYKPEDEDKFKTDTYGYTETEFFEAFTLTNLSDEEADLVGAFVPIAVDEEIGGFRDNATKTNSLIDRLKAMTLPDIDDVADDLERFIDVKERAEELDEKIEKTDQLIDEIVYDLYDLTDEEIGIVESAVADD